MDIDRKLASVRRISAIDPIPNADNIVCVTVDGWKLVSDKKNNFQVGQLVIYLEIDSFLPIREEFEWMRDRCYRNAPGIGEGFRVKTIKLRGQVSQGLIVPMSDFIQKDELGQWYYEDYSQATGYQLGAGDTVAYYVEEGSDLTDFIGVKKYEKPIPANMQGRTKGNFPSFIRKTDQERVQNNWGGIKKWITVSGSEPVLCEDQDIHDSVANGLTTYQDGNERYFKKNDEWYYISDAPNSFDVIRERGQFEATLKLDGSSLTVYQFNGTFGVCSRNLELKRDAENPFWKATLASGILPYLAQSGENIALQFELMGPGVQGNRENLTDFHIFLFNVFDIDTQKYWLPKHRIAWFKDIYENSGFINKSSISHAPVLLNIQFDGSENMEYFLGIADTQKSLFHQIAEGVVFKSYVENGPSFKVISNKFLLKEKD